MRTSAVFTKLFKLWRLLGIRFSSETLLSKHKEIAFKTYTFALRFFIIYYFPLGLFINLKNFDFSVLFMENVVIAVATTVSFMKYILASRNRLKITRILEICNELDTKPNKHLDESKISSIRIFNIFYSILITFCAFNVLCMFYIREEKLLIEQYIPVDWRNCYWLRYLAILYQLLGIVVHMTWTLSFDCFTAITINLMNGHLRALSYRCVRMASSTNLLESIIDHQLITEMISLVQSLISTIMLWLFFQTVVCVVIYSTMIIISDIPFMEAITAVITVCCFLIEIIFTCYFGSEFSSLISSLPHAVYSCSWFEQPKQFRRDMVLFVELCLTEKTLTAGGLFSVDLKTLSIILSKILNFLMILRTYYINRGGVVHH